VNSPERSSSQERWLRFFNNVVYNALAPVYNSMDWLTFGAWWRLVRRALDFVPAGASVLEVGFGPGRLHFELVQRSSLCIGLDLAVGMCRYTRRRLQHMGLVSRITRGSVFALPYPLNAFDVVVSTFAFSGFPRGADAMREMARVTKVGGRVVLVDIGLPSNNNRAGVFWARLWERMGDFLYDQPELMQQAGLKNTVFKEFGPGDHIRAIVGEKLPPDST
jgi:ubiquinone/menaquinone biosynthesis C-methylase UbiE